MTYIILRILDTYVGTEHHEHSPNIPEGAAGVKAGLRAYFEQLPQLSVVPKWVIAEGDLVAVHSHYVDTPQVAIRVRPKPADR